MATVDAQILLLRSQITSCEAQLQRLRVQLAEAERNQLLSSVGATDVVSYTTLSQPESVSQTWPLHKNEYKRYGRQLIMPEIGLTGTVTCEQLGYASFLFLLRKF
jgi:adenylyltransferase/sulfurtransferase